MVFLGVLMSALVLSSAASAKTSKYCSVLSGHDVGRPLGISSLRVQSVTVKFPSVARGNGRVTLCTLSTPADSVAETSVAKCTSATGARNEFAAIIHRERKSVRAKKTSGPWTDAYFLQQDGFLTLKGRYMFHIQYASGAQNYSHITPKVLAGLAAKAVKSL